MSGAPQLARDETTTEAGEEPPSMENRRLRVELEIERGGPCTMDYADGNIVDIDVRFDDGDCQCDIGVQKQTEDGEQTETKYFSNSICDHCPGIVFVKYGCIPRYLRIGDGSFVMETYVPDTETVSSIVSDVRERCNRVVVRSITSTERLEYPETCTIDVSALTPKQREAVHRAKQAGYYDPDTKVPLEELATEMSISKSALSQRLQRAEANVIRQLSCGCDCWNEER
ncbi:helix-turn-helix domain-containing protein [Halalkaliarchaeum sp. AArc-GB]|uniref:helix-turn-helix domain-containing protein n=1 Tax=Halalkaliarchaeum sp. AArc-GB TaxID=3074078 RepID=UPI00285D3D82|nr:helix-turn-helix domain-containing protein [Halalkaliarchaeum sp. AArc-GB]MDR5673186.1 helix-turn-helix domain-containing protein [Halalkaliarchaeum sp. AArc-GB]